MTRDRPAQEHSIKAQLDVLVLGPLPVTLDGRPVIGLECYRGSLLLAYLAVEV